MPNPNLTKPPSILKLIIISVAIGLLGGMLLIGIPGALVLELVALAYHHWGLKPMTLSGDAVWPAAIMISLLWTLPITPLSMMHFKLFPQHTPLWRWLFSLTGSILLTLAVVFLLLL